MNNSAPYENEIESKWFSRIRFRDVETQRWILSPVEGEEFDGEDAARKAMNEFKPTDECFFIDDLITGIDQRLSYEIGCYDHEDFIAQDQRMFVCKMEFVSRELK